MPVDIAREPPAKLVARVRNDLAEIAPLAEALDAFGADNGVPGAVIFNFNLALDELLTNIISYGYADCDGAHDILVSIAVADGVITAEIVDDGQLFNPLDAPAPDIEAPIGDRPVGGLGVHLVKAMMDSVSYECRDGHNHLTISKAF